MSDTVPAITWDELQHFQYRRRFDAMLQQGIRLIPDDVPRLNEIFAALPGTPALLSEPGDPELARRARKDVVLAALTQLAAELAAAGVYRTAEQTPMQGTSPEPDVWANGVALQRVAETALRELDELAAIASLGNWQGGADIREITGVGLLIDEQGMSELTGVTVSTLRLWRTNRTHFEFVKFPGQRGPVRYTERGIRAFFDVHTAPLAKV